MASLRTCPGLRDGKRNILGHKIRRLREEAGFNQAAFVIHLQKHGWDIDQRHSARLESGKQDIADFELQIYPENLESSLGDIGIAFANQAVQLLGLQILSETHVFQSPLYKNDIGLHRELDRLIVWQWRRRYYLPHLVEQRRNEWETLTREFSEFLKGGSSHPHSATGDDV